MVGQHDDQGLVDVQARPAVPAASLAEPVGSLTGPGQPVVAELRVLPYVESGVVPAGLEQGLLAPGSGWRWHRRRIGRLGRPGRSYLIVDGLGRRSQSAVMPEKNNC